MILLLGIMAPLDKTLKKKVLPIGALDLMIAAHAQYLNMTLVTNNTKEFSRVSNLMIENWSTLP